SWVPRLRSNRGEPSGVRVREVLQYPVVGKSFRSATSSTLRSMMLTLSTARFGTRLRKYKYFPSADQLGKPAGACVSSDHFRVRRSKRKRPSAFADMAAMYRPSGDQRGE